MSRSSPIRARYVNNENSSPVHRSPESAKSTGRRKKLPTVTPKRFTRFFTPRSVLNANSPTKIGRSRRVLQDITASGVNRQVSVRSITENLTVLDECTAHDQRHAKRRKVGTFDRPSLLPLGRNRRAQGDFGGEQAVRRIHDRATSTSDGDLRDELDIVEHPDYIDCHNSRDHPVNGGLHRELSSTKHAVFATQCDWQAETASFFTSAGDKHVCKNIVPAGPPLAVPFCTASCNKNSIVAIGDEEGGIRLLETDPGWKGSISIPHLSFRPHRNAILDLAFSPDDMLLATGSGDQKAHIVDIKSQQVTHSLTGHSASLKQVRFQPESSSVVATSARDGSVQIWDLRCRSGNDAVVSIETAVEQHDSVPGLSATHQPSALTVARKKAIFDAHGLSMTRSVAGVSHDTRTCLERPSKDPKARSHGIEGVSVTALSFVGQGRDHLLLSGGQANAVVKLWDLRATQSRRSPYAVALSSTRPPKSHSRRHWGLTSITMSSDGSKFYTLCKDKTVYAYATSHLILGDAPELSSCWNKYRPRRFADPKTQGLGPLYGFKHAGLQVDTFYVKAALRSSVNGNTELLAVGSSKGTPILFPTDERALHSSRSPMGNLMPIYDHGTALIRGHEREVTDVTWTPNGELISIGDDLTARCWREGPEARELRLGGEGEGRRWESGWSEVVPGWDDDDA